MIMEGALMLFYLLAGLLSILTFLVFLLAIIKIEIYFSIGESVKMGTVFEIMRARFLKAGVYLCTTVGFFREALQVG
jgi:hypothetical protein